MRKYENREGVKKALSFYAIIDITCLGERDEKRLINRLFIHSYTICNVHST